MSDLNYIEQGLFTSFVPNTKAGEEAWKKIAVESEGTGKVFTAHLQSTLKQLRAAGYTVTKAKPVSKREADKIADELESLGL